MTKVNGFSTGFYFAKITQTNGVIVSAIFVDANRGLCFKLGLKQPVTVEQISEIEKQGYAEFYPIDVPNVFQGELMIGSHPANGFYFMELNATFSQVNKQRNITVLYIEDSIAMIVGDEPMETKSLIHELTYGKIRIYDKIEPKVS